MIEVYNDCPDKKEDKLPQPKLKLNICNKMIFIIAVDEHGTPLANIWTSKYGMSNSAKECIRDGKHSTDWAEWDKLGKFIKLT